MKKFIAAALAGMAVLCGAADINLLDGKWSQYNKTNDKFGTVIRKDGQVDCFSTVPKGMTGICKGLIFKKPLTGTVVFGADVKGEKVVGSVPNNFCVYIDITFTDNSKQWGLTCPFKTGTFGWQKMSRTYKFSKPVARMHFYVLFRNMTGKASFKNVFLYNK